MNSTTPARSVHRRSILGAMAFGTTVWSEAARSQAGRSGDPAAPSSLTRRQLAIAPIGAGVALGDLPALSTALHDGLDAGLAISEVKEILVQMYAYTGFPRSLNALGELMKVLDARKQRGVQDPPGQAPGPVP